MNAHHPYHSAHRNLRTIGDQVTLNFWLWLSGPLFSRNQICAVLALLVMLVFSAETKSQRGSSASPQGQTVVVTPGTPVLSDAAAAAGIKEDTATVPLRERLMQRLNLLIKYQRAQNWRKQYDLLSEVVTQGDTKDEHTRRLKHWYSEGLGDVLVDFVPKSIAVHSPSQDHGEWTLFGCATLREKGRIVRLYAAASAYREKDDWYFSPIGVITPIDGKAEPCDKVFGHAVDSTRAETTTASGAFRKPTNVVKPAYPPLAAAKNITSANVRPIRKLLTSLQSVKDDREALATLFNTGDEQIVDLIEALHDPNQNVRLRAQIVIRYLGNETGMNALEDWYSKQVEVVTSGPITLPLRERDYEFINGQYLNKPAAAWAGADQYIFALALDGSPRAKALLDELKKSAGTIDDSTVGGRAIRLTTAGTESVVIGRHDLAKSVSEKAFFITTKDRPFTSAKLLGFNGTKDKALIEVYINRGRLAEEWYHVVLSKHGHGWKFFSITQVAVS